MRAFWTMCSTNLLTYLLTKFSAITSQLTTRKDNARSSQYACGVDTHECP